MINRIFLKRGSKDEAEKPFWISYADMMTALMVLFLVVMSVALLAVTKTISEGERLRGQREGEVAAFMSGIKDLEKKFPGIRVDLNRHVIDFRDRANFETDRHQLSPAQGKFLRTFIPEVLGYIRSHPGGRWLKRVVVEGYTDRRGTYLHNLNLSMKRAQRVLCVLLDESPTTERPLTADEREQVRELFLVGGYSYNSSKSSLEESRRVELRFEFWQFDESRTDKEAIPHGPFGACELED